MHRFYIDPQQTILKEPVIIGTDAKHIINTLRLKPGHRVGLFDGTGAEFEASIVAVAKQRVTLKIENTIQAQTESPVKITIGQGFLKEKKMDILVRQLTELGISRWIPILTERSVARPDHKRTKARVQRWQKIAQEAVKQCRRTLIPEIGEPLLFDDFLPLTHHYGMKIIFWEEDPLNMPLHDLTQENQISEVLILIGPEGGFASQEIEKARAVGFVTVGLGPRILRAETATVAACTLIQHIFGDMSQKKA